MGLGSGGRDRTGDLRIMMTKVCLFSSMTYLLRVASVSRLAEQDLLGSRQFSTVVTGRE